ncbi:carbohydrate ABC transporter permease [Pararhizobium mangrovi]|uniref:Carbohydrate ABC transporter permease n=1 Tax=Pararhizobium mangrovi TaxID=2590452 RepID=A0A506U2F1_9HYPH|nr:carbohydrate ABC transporter permease [Pararhizobium mangrovi]TPW27556.1 carbohydrate ABC transporter permease [Pararhizobium mangrovi]
MTRTKQWPIMVTLAVALVALVVNIPLIGALLTSFKPDGAITSHPLSIPVPGTLQHYANVLYAAGYDFPLFFENSAIIAFGTVVLTTLISVPAAYAIVRLKLGGQWLLNAVAAMRLLPAMFFVLPFFVMLTNVGLLDTVWGMIVVDTFLNLPIAMVILARGVADVPIEIEEAARMDGASSYGILVTMIVPLLAPSIAAAALITFLFTWNDYIFAIIITTSAARTVTVGVSQFVTSYGILWGDVSAGVVLSVIIPIVFAIFGQRYLVSGLASGSVKG